MVSRVEKKQPRQKPKRKVSELDETAARVSCLSLVR